MKRLGLASCRRSNSPRLSFQPKQRPNLRRHRYRMVFCVWCMAYSASVLAQQRHRPNLSHTSFHAMARRGIPSLQLRQAVAKPLHTSFLFCSVFISRAHIRSMRIFGTSKAASSRASCQGHLSWPLRMN